MTDYDIGEERPGAFPDWREYPLLIDGKEHGKIEKTAEGYRADVTYMGLPRETLALAYEDGQRQREAGQGRFTGEGLILKVTAIAETETKPKRLKVTGGGNTTEVSWNWAYSGPTLGEWAVRQVRPKDEPVLLRHVTNGWEFRI